ECRGRRVVEAAAEAVPPIASPSPVGPHRAARDVEDAPKDIRNAAPQRGAAVAADGLVMCHGAIPERDLATLGNGEWVPAIIPETATDARVHDGAGRVAVAADGAVVAERHVAEGQGHRFNR